MALKQPWFLLVVLLFLGGCSGGSPYVPYIGPYDGMFLAEDTPVGAMTLTVSNGLLGGTGNLIHNNQTITISISAFVDGRTIQGTVANASQGSGNIVGVFDQNGNLSGEFNFKAIGEDEPTTGTWHAEHNNTL